MPDSEIINVYLDKGKRGLKVQGGMALPAITTSVSDNNITVFVPMAKIEASNISDQIVTAYLLPKDKDWYDKYEPSIVYEDLGNNAIRVTVTITPVPDWEGTEIIIDKPPGFGNGNTVVFGSYNSATTTATFINSIVKFAPKSKSGEILSSRENAVLHDDWSYSFTFTLAKVQPTANIIATSKYFMANAVVKQTILNAGIQGVLVRCAAKGVYTYLLDKNTILGPPDSNNSQTGNYNPIEIFGNLDWVGNDGTILSFDGPTNRYGTNSIAIASNYIFHQDKIIEHVSYGCGVAKVVNEENIEEQWIVTCTSIHNIAFARCKIDGSEYTQIAGNITKPSGYTPQTSDDATFAFFSGDAKKCVIVWRGYIIECSFDSNLTNVTSTITDSNYEETTGAGLNMRLLRKQCLAADYRGNTLIRRTLEMKSIPEVDDTSVHVYIQNSNITWHIYDDTDNAAQMMIVPYVGTYSKYKTTGVVGNLLYTDTAFDYELNMIVDYEYYDATVTIVESQKRAFIFILFDDMRYNNSTMYIKGHDEIQDVTTERRDCLFIRASNNGNVLYEKYNTDRSSDVLIASGTHTALLTKVSPDDYEYNEYPDSLSGMQSGIFYKPNDWYGSASCAIHPDLGRVSSFVFNASASHTEATDVIYNQTPLNSADIFTKIGIV